MGDEAQVSPARERWVQGKRESRAP